MEFNIKEEKQRDERRKRNRETREGRETERREKEEKQRDERRKRNRETREGRETERREKEEKQRDERRKSNQDILLGAQSVFNGASCNVVELEFPIDVLCLPLPVDDELVAVDDEGTVGMRLLDDGDIVVGTICCDCNDGQAVELNTSCDFSSLYKHGLALFVFKDLSMISQLQLQSEAVIDFNDFPTNERKRWEKRWEKREKGGKREKKIQMRNRKGGESEQGRLFRSRKYSSEVFIEFVKSRILSDESLSLNFTHRKVLVEKRWEGKS